MRRRACHIAAAVCLAVTLSSFPAERALALNFVVTYTDRPNRGFYSPTSGAARRAAFEYALTMWEGWITNTQTGSADNVYIYASFPSMGWVDGQSNTLGGTSNEYWVYGGGNALTPAQYKLQTGQLPNHTGADAIIQFNSNAPFYLGTDGKPSSSQIDLVSVVLHEVGHLMGMFDTYDPGTASWGTTTINNSGSYLSEWDTYLRDYHGVAPTVGTSSFNVLTAPATFVGPLAKAANNGSAVGVYTANPFQNGSSLCHVATGNDNPLMAYAIGYGQVRHGMWNYEEGVFGDLGWGFTSPTNLGTTGRSGNWNQGDAWVGGLPPVAGTVVRIDATAGWPTSSSYTIQLRDAAAPASVTISGPGKLSLIQSANLTTTNVTCNGAMEITSAAALANLTTLRVGWGGTGTFTQSAGNVNLASDLVLGDSGGGNGTYAISGGSLSVRELYVGRAGGSGALNLNSSLATVSVSDLLHFDTNASMTAVSNSKIRLTGNVEIAGTNSDNIAGLASTTLVFEGGPTVNSTLEVAGKDYGAALSAWSHNFALGTLQIGAAASSHLTLTDLVVNQPSPNGPEALYVNNLVINAGAVIDLNGLDLYYLNGTTPKQFFLGDADLSGAVDSGDFNLLLANWNYSGTSWATADFTGDGYVDSADFNVLLTNWNGCDSSRGSKLYSGQ